MQFKSRSSALAAALVMSFQAQAADLQMLDEVVVTAPRSDEPLTVKTDPKAPRQPVPAHDGADYLKSIPGFSVIRKGGTDGDPVFRGMAGSRLNILLDGEQILGGCGGRMDPPTAYVFPASYDHITVLKGPQTVTHGPGNSAGVVLFERDFKRADQVGTKGNASLTLGSFGRNDEVAEVRIGSESAYARVGGTRSHAGDYKDGNGVAVHSAYTRWSGNTALGWTPSDDTRLEMTLAKSDGQAAYADRSVDGSKFARDNYGLKFDKKHLSPLVDSIEAQAYYNYVDHVMDIYSLRSGNPASTMAAMNPDRKTTGGRAEIGLALGGATKAKVGVDLQNNVHTGRTGAAPGYAGDYTLKPRVQDASSNNKGVFGEVNHNVSERSRVIGGLRLDSWHAEDNRANIQVTMMGSVANPTAGQSRNETLGSGFARYEQDLASSTVYAGLGHTARAPDYWELISKEGETTASAFNIKPEKTTQLDVGLNFAGERLSGSVSAFYSKVTDFILIQSNTAARGAMMTLRNPTITRNIKATTWGTEAGLVYQLANSWKLDGSLAFVQGNNDTDGVALGQIPPLEARVGANYDDKVWSFGTLLRMVSAQDRFTANQGNIAGQDIGRTGGFGVFSLNGGWRPRKGAQLTAGIDNLFNKVYAEHISRAGSMVAGFTQTTRVNEVGRNLWVKANIKFD